MKNQINHKFESGEFYASNDERGTILVHERTETGIIFTFDWEDPETNPEFSYASIQVENGAETITTKNGWKFSSKDIQ